MATTFHQSERQRQAQNMGAQQLQSIRLLAKSLPELRAEIAAEMSANPAIEDVDHPLETSLSDVEARQREETHEPDYPEDDFTPGTSADEAAAERRQAFFDRQVKTETLQEHLLSQLPLSDIAPTDWPLAAVLVGDLNPNGYYRGSLADACMAFGRTEKDVRALLAKIAALDPCGCGATTPQECLLAQLDKLEDSPYEEDVRKIILHHLEDVAAGRFATVERSLGLTREQYVGAIKELRTLDAFPGRAFPSERDRVEYVNPEIHAVRCKDGWFAETDRRSLPEIRISRTFERLLSDPRQSEETKQYVRERIEAARAFRDAVERRQETVAAIAQAIFDRQQGFFEQGFPALVPLTESEIAEAVGVSVATVSRTVCDKYAQTPFGTVELRRFFVSGIKTTAGGSLTQDAVLRKLKAVIAAEDPHAPLSDDQLAAELRKSGLELARRTISKYRGQLGLPNAAHRRRE